MVELRTSMSISPDCSARKRCWAESGTYLALVASPSTAAATALHRSTSRPDHLPWLSGSEKPPRPTLTPQISWPRFLTTSRVDGVCAEAAETTKASAPKAAPTLKIRWMRCMDFPPFLERLSAVCLARQQIVCNKCINFGTYGSFDPALRSDAAGK